MAEPRVETGRESVPLSPLLPSLTRYFRLSDMRVVGGKS